jgi:hypothetical protein
MMPAVLPVRARLPRSPALLLAVRRSGVGSVFSASGLGSVIQCRVAYRLVRLLVSKYVESHLQLHLRTYERTGSK